MLITSQLPIVWTVVKIFFLIGLGVYLIFALVVIKQAQIMTQSVKLQFEIPIKILALIHFVFAVGVFLFVLIAL
jgi:hypothetical protein